MKRHALTAGAGAPLGAYLINKMIQEHFIVELDHMHAKTAGRLILTDMFHGAEAYLGASRSHAAARGARGRRRVSGDAPDGGRGDAPGGGSGHARESAGDRTRPPGGLCDSCRHQRLIRNTRGSEFSLCDRSRDEPERFPRYPRLPVTACAGHERRAAS